MLVTCLHVSFQGGSTFGLRECSWTLRNHWIFGRDCNCADSPRNNTFFFPQGKRIQEIWLGMFFSPPSVDSGLLIYQLYDLGMFFGWFSYSEWQFKVKIMLGKNVGEICWYLDYHPRLHLGWRCRMLPPKGAKGVFLVYELVYPKIWDETFTTARMERLVGRGTYWSSMRALVIAMENGRFVC